MGFEMSGKAITFRKSLELCEGNRGLSRSDSESARFQATIEMMHNCSRKGEVVGCRKLQPDPEILGNALRILVQRGRGCVEFFRPNMGLTRLRGYFRDRSPSGVANLMACTTR
jgi:hypothetical protein